MKTKNHYETMGVGPDATAEDIRAAYRRQRGNLHPDREGGDADAMAALNAANTVLSDPDEREKYDASVPNVERDALLHMQATLSRYIDADCNPIQHSREDIAEKMSRAKAAKKHNNSAIEKITKHLGRVKFTGPGKNVVAEMMMKRIRDAEEEIESIDHAIKVLGRSLELLRAYEYEVPEPTPPTILDCKFGSSTNSNAGFWLHGGPME
jgi:DnaJ-class molecular chaperone